MIEENPRFTKPKILETVLYAEDLDSCHSFYAGVLGLEVISFDSERDLFLRLAESVLIIFKASKTVIPDGGIPPHGAIGPGHVAFAVTTAQELEGWRQLLLKKGVNIIQEKTWRNGSKSIYFHDPAGNILEVAMRSLWFAE